jgi:hypothetical protein
VPPWCDRGRPYSEGMDRTVGYATSLVKISRLAISERRRLPGASCERVRVAVEIVLHPVEGRTDAERRSPTSTAVANLCRHGLLVAMAIQIVCNSTTGGLSFGQARHREFAGRLRAPKLRASLVLVNS